MSKYVKKIRLYAELLKCKLELYRYNRLISFLEGSQVSEMKIAQIIAKQVTLVKLNQACIHSELEMLSSQSRQKRYSYEQCNDRIEATIQRS